MNGKRHLLIFLLAAWLPMQSLAGILLHCEFIEHHSVAHGEMSGVPLGEMPGHKASAHKHAVAIPADVFGMHAAHSANSTAALVDADSPESLPLIPLADCHGQDASSKSNEIIESPALADNPALNDESQCNHCNGSCHGLQQLSLHASDNNFVSTLNSFSPSSAAAEISSIPENPQRPPKLP